MASTKGATKTGPLAGITIVEVADYLTAGGDVILADMGADVIKIEDPVRGDSLRGLIEMMGSSMSVSGDRNIAFETANRSKRSITLNLAHDKGRQVLYRLLGKVDVFYTNYRPDVLRKLGIDYETLSKHKPSLVYGLITSYGSKGPWAGRRGYDLLAQGRSGLMWAMGDRDIDEPMLVYGAVCDQTGGTMLALGLLAALLARDRMGIGQKVEVSMYGSMLYLQSTGLNVTSFRNRPWARHSRTRVREPMSNFYRCADNKWIVLNEMRGDEQWPKFARALGLEHLAEDPRYATTSGRRENYQEVIQTIDDAFVTKTQVEWLETFAEWGLDTDGFAYCPVFQYTDVLNDPQALENKYVIEHDHPTAGKVKVIGYPVNFSATPAEVKAAAPEHGQHTEEVLLDQLGFDWDEIANLRDEGII